MKAYKGFNKDMTCRGFQYEEGKEYETDKAELCNSGFHACEAPIDCFRYYAPAESVYHEVELSGVTEESSNDTKKCGTKIKIGAKIDIAGIVKAHVDFVKSHTTMENVDEKSATAGYRGAATAGDRGAATAGDCGAATAGNRGAATAGDCGAATAGDCGAATAGDCGAATAGNRGAATSRGCSKTGKNGLSVVRGRNVKVMGGMGAVLVLCEENSNNYNISAWAAVVVDGVKIKPDTWYTLKDGEVVEAKEE